MSSTLEDYVGSGERILNAHEASESTICSTALSSSVNFLLGNSVSIRVLSGAPFALPLSEASLVQKCIRWSPSRTRTTESTRSRTIVVLPLA